MTRVSVKLGYISSSIKGYHLQKPIKLIIPLENSLFFFILSYLFITYKSFEKSQKIRSSWSLLFFTKTGISMTMLISSIFATNKGNSDQRKKKIMKIVISTFHGISTFYWLIISIGIFRNLNFVGEKNEFEKIGFEKFFFCWLSLVVSIVLLMVSLIFLVMIDSKKISVKFGSFFYHTLPSIFGPISVYFYWISKYSENYKGKIFKNENFKPKKNLFF